MRVFKARWTAGGKTRETDRWYVELTIGARQRIAFTQRADAPVFEEHGIIAPRVAADAEPSEHWANS